jgi:hypothetical protein
MLQVIVGQKIYVVEFETMPQLPITWKTEEEKPYALALAQAIHEKIITEPGKYGIFVEIDTQMYNVFKILE